MKPMPWWKRWPNRARLALVALKYRLARLLHRLGVLPESARASTDTMGDWARLQATPDDPPPGLRRPPAGPYSDIIRRVRLYAQNGAKALGPLLDKPAPPDTTDMPKTLDECEAARQAGQDREGIADTVAAALLDELDLCGSEAIVAIHAAYNSPWTVVDGEVYDVVTEKEREGVQ